jgi:hypothetical protein
MRRRHHGYKMIGGRDRGFPLPSDSHARPSKMCRQLTPPCYRPSYLACCKAVEDTSRAIEDIRRY